MFKYCMFMCRANVHVCVYVYGEIKRSIYVAFIDYCDLTDIIYMYVYSMDLADKNVCCQNFPV